MRRAQEEFRRALDAAILPQRIGQLELFSDEEEQFIQQEVERKLYKPKLPNAGQSERIYLEKLKTFARDESLVVVVKMAAGRYAEALETLLPRQQFIRRKMRKANPTKEEGGGDEADEAESGKRESNWLTLPGSYYTRKDVTAKTNKSLYAACNDLKSSAGRDVDKRWLANYLLEGLPEEVANFNLECLYLLRGSDGNVTRLVRLVNTVGEMSEGPETGGTDILPPDLYASAEKFRAWCLSKGNFNWGVGESAGNIELQKLQRDASNDSAYKVAKLIEYCGWHPLKGAWVDGEAAGLWFMDDCAYTTNGDLLMPDNDGVINYNGDIFVLARKGREGEFAHGRPKMRPLETVADMKLDQSEWEPASKEMPVLSGFFREVCRRFNETTGGPGGWMTVGAMLGYAAGPEFFDFNRALPSIFLPGQMGSGKSVYANWAMGIQGYQPTQGLGLGKGSRVTPVGLCQQLENYSNMALWFDEYREYEISDDKKTIIRDAYDRQLAGKWTPDGKQRVIRTTPMISGETDTGDGATRSRYVHQQISASQRTGNHMDWMRTNRQYFFLFWRHLMMNRREYTKIVMRLVGDWMKAPDTQHIPERSRLTHSLPYAAFAAATVLFESHTPEDVMRFRKFMIERSAMAAEDVSSNVNVNIFIQDMITAFKAGAIPPECFRIEREPVLHPPGKPNQGYWESFVLYIDPKSTLLAMQIYLRKAGQAVALAHNDLRDQLSKNVYWKRLAAGKKLNKRFGKAGSKETIAAWGIVLDLHPLGLQDISDEDYQDALGERAATLMDEAGQIYFTDGDPRKGELFAIIEGVRKYEAKERQNSAENP